MRKDGLENIFRNRFVDHSESIDTDDMIARLNLDEPKEKKRIFIFWWFGVIGGLLLTVGLFYVFGDSEFSLAPSLIDADESHTISKDDMYASNEIENVKQDSDVVISDGKQIQNNVIETNVGHVKLEEKSIKSAVVKGKEIRIYNVNNDKVNRRQQIEVQNKLDRASMNFQDGYQVIHNEFLSSENPPSQVDAVVKSNDVGRSHIKRSEETLSRPLIKSAILDILSIDELENRPRTVIANRKYILTDVLDSNEKDVKKHPLLIEMFGSVNKVNRTLESDSYQDHVDLRNQQEKQLEAIQFGLSITKPLNKRFYISIGAEVTVINEQANIEYTTDTNFVNDNFPILHQIKVSGDTITSFGTVNVESKINHRLIEYNRHRLFSIPLNLGMQGKISKLGWFADAGLSLNYYQGFFGSMSGIDIVVVDNPNYFDAKVGIGYRTKIGVVYPLNNRFSLSTSINFQGMLSSIADAKYVSQKYVFTGLGLGVRCNLN